MVAVGRMLLREMRLRLPIAPAASAARGRLAAPTSTSTRASVNGWSNANAVGVQELALEAEVAGDPVHGVAADGKLDRLEVHADLVRAAGLEPQVEQRPLAELLPHLEPA